MNAAAQLETAVSTTGQTAQRATQSQDTTAILAALDELTELRRAIEHARSRIGTFGPDLVRAALQAGVRPADLMSRPYSPPVVWRHARDLGLTRDTRDDRED